MKLKDFTINALKIAGVTDAELSDIIATDKVDEYVLGEDLIKKFNAGVLTLESAKANATLKGHFNAQTYNGIDALVAKLVEENDLDSLAKFDIDSEKSTQKKIELLTKALNKKVANGTKNPATADEIKTLNAQLATLKGEFELTLKNKDNDYENMLISMQRSSYLQTKDYANIADREIGAKIADEYLNKAFTEKGAKLVRENGQLKLKNAMDTSVDFYENNKAVSFNEFADSVLAQNNLLKVSQTPATTATQTITTTGKTDANSTVLNANKAQLEQMKANSGQG